MSSAESKGRGAHTPGPWFVGAQNDGLYVIDKQPSPAPYDAPIPATHGPNVVATPNWRLPEYQANARLIAAAPDLLAALEELLKIRSGRTVSAARAAIARATGESS